MAKYSQKWAFKGEYDDATETITEYDKDGNVKGVYNLREVLASLNGSTISISIGEDTEPDSIE